MTQTSQKFTVVLVERFEGTTQHYPYNTLEDAFEQANHLRNTLEPKQGGRVFVMDMDGRQLQCWIEHATGGEFTSPGGFNA